jgi:hypothetical protein
VTLSFRSITIEKLKFGPLYVKRNPTIFLAFAGLDAAQNEDVFHIADGYECWNLRKFGLDDFIEALKKKIPPVNDNVLRYYKAKSEPENIGVTDELFEKCSWGLLVPDSLEDAAGNSYSETVFLMNLYSPTFLYPLFYASDFGMRPAIDKLAMFFPSYQNQSLIFKTKEFVKFFKIMLSQSQYGTWASERAQRWNKEDWRLFVAGMLYSGLRDYDSGKNSFGWQRESADMATILESLFTAGDSQSEEIGYRLRKRIGALLSHRFASIEDDVKKLYSERSAFVHGSFFAQIAKDSKRAYSGLPSPDFGSLYQQKEYVRWALVAYMHLAEVIRIQPESYGGLGTVIGMLEKAILDTELRKIAIQDVEEVLSLLPISSLDGGTFPAHRL